MDEVIKIFRKRWYTLVWKDEGRVIRVCRNRGNDVFLEVVRGKGE